MTFSPPPGATVRLVRWVGFLRPSDHVLVAGSKTMVSPLTATTLPDATRVDWTGSPSPALAASGRGDHVLAAGSYSSADTRSLCVPELSSKPRAASTLPLGSRANTKPARACDMDAR